VTGESYGGYYVPYIANYIYENPGVVDLALKGIWIADPTLSSDAAQEQIGALRFAQANANLFPFTNAQWTALQNISDTCNYTTYLDKYVTYPPKGPLPLPSGSTVRPPGCNIWTEITSNVTKYVVTFTSATKNSDVVCRLNPAFNVYRVADVWPEPCRSLRCITKTICHNTYLFQGALLVSLSSPRNSFTSIVLMRVCYHRRMQH
jgi:carboxypeptidase D